MTNEEACKEIGDLLCRLNGAIEESQETLKRRPPCPPDAPGWNVVMDAADEYAKKQIAGMLNSKAALEIALSSLMGPVLAGVANG